VDTLRYAGQRVIVTGAAGGVGEAVTTLLVELGAEVHALDVRRPQARGLASITETDLRDREQVEAAAKRIGAIVNGLFHCASVDVDALRDLLEHAVPNMIPGSAIVAAADAHAVTDYTTSRAPALASEHGIRMNCVHVAGRPPVEAAWPLLVLNSPGSAPVTGAALLPPR
jgi:uncharacterized protein YbjT (DUF2867 family)